MEKLLSCRTLGYDCDFEACGDTAKETLETAIDHARAIHGLKDLSEKDLMRVRGEVRDSFCVPKGGYNPGGMSAY
jgi:predicted small metal-binding protein